MKKTTNCVVWTGDNIDEVRHLCGGNAYVFDKEKKWLKVLSPHTGQWQDHFPGDTIPAAKY